MMIGGEVAQIIVAVATLVTSVGAMCASVGAVLMSSRNATKIEEVHKATNSLTDRLVATTRSDAEQAGIAMGRKIEKDAQS